MSWLSDKVSDVGSFVKDTVSSTVTGSLDLAGAATAGLISPELAVNAYPRETLLAGGAVVAGSYLAGAGEAAAGTAATGTAATGTVVAGAIAEKTLGDKAVDFLVESAMKNQAAKDSGFVDGEVVYDSPRQNTNFNQGLNLNNPVVLGVGGLALVSLLIVATRAK